MKNLFYGKKQYKKTVTILMIIVLVFGLGVCSVVLQRNSENKEIESTYKKANKFYKEKNYLSAIKNYKLVLSYKDSKNKLQKCYFDYSNYLLMNKEYKKALTYSKKCSSDDCTNLKNEINYQLALSLFDSNDTESVKILRKLNSYKDSQEYIKKYEFNHKYEETYQGVEYSSNFGTKRPNDSNFTIAKRKDSNRVEIYSCKKDYGCNLDNENIICNDDYSICSVNISDEFEKTTITYKFYDNSLLETSNSVYSDGSVLNYTVSSTKISDSTELFKSVKKSSPSTSGMVEQVKEPEIGMTKEEVENSTWGEPYHKNKSTYSWGTTEQWVYKVGRYGRKYIYFKNGIVSSISEEEK